ncbi:hypothetical protein [Micromonospora sp. NPDC049102]|uniref:hypothetical protein n=1 Tax=Micromonospora sp. NPDC049102 TaxID=3364265 RepID=UPI003723EBB3
MNDGLVARRSARDVPETLAAHQRIILISAVSGTVVDPAVALFGQIRAELEQPAQ